ncbi:MAG: hypothetical protein OET42_04715, partial [Deltaproteobacteria bacterium]|nr:hypothetical protein [Deltaproteobacteria bacterium]
EPISALRGVHFCQWASLSTCLELWTINRRSGIYSVRDTKLAGAVTKVQGWLRQAEMLLVL